MAKTKHINRNLKVDKHFHKQKDGLGHYKVKKQGIKVSKELKEMLKNEVKDE
jgi:hypothetical protein